MGFQGLEIASTYGDSIVLQFEVVLAWVTTNGPWVMVYDAYLWCDAKPNGKQQKGDDTPRLAKETQQENDRQTQESNVTKPSWVCTSAEGGVVLLVMTMSAV